MINLLQFKPNDIIYVENGSSQYFFLIEKIINKYEFYAYAYVWKFEHDSNWVIRFKFDKSPIKCNLSSFETLTELYCVICQLATQEQKQLFMRKIKNYRLKYE